MPFEAPNELFSNWLLAKLADVAVTESNTVTSNIAPANWASVRSTPFSITSLRLASLKMRARQQDGSASPWIRRSGTPVPPR